MAALRIATWNVNGIRAREAQFLAWLEAESPDVVCLQEIKASPDQLSFTLTARPDYFGRWHGGGGYSGVALLLKKATFGDAPRFFHPPFDTEHRALAAETGAGLTFMSLYLPNGGKDYPAKLAFLDAFAAYATAARDARWLVAGDMNVTRDDRDVHPSQRKADAIGQRPEERASFERLFLAEHGALRDAQRVLDPEGDRLFTWWPMWKAARARNLGWRIDYVMPSRNFPGKEQSATIGREVGSSDHAPLIVELG
jgi:exodeoxyribonuclease-3